MSLRKDRIFRAFTSIVGNVGEALFAPFILSYIFVEYFYRLAKHKIKGTAHPHELQNWKRKEVKKSVSLQSDTK